MTEIIVPFSHQEYAVAPEGTQPALCYGVLLLGTLPSKFGPKKRIRLMFELHGDERMPDGRPFAVFQDFTFSSNEKSLLRIFIEAWRGRQYTNGELKQLNGLPVSKLIGQLALVCVSHTPNQDGEGVWVNIKTIMKPPKGMETPVMVNEPLIYSVDDHDQAAFDRLYPKLQERIKSTPEWMARNGNAEIPPAYQNIPSNGIPADFDDEIPF